MDAEVAGGAIEDDPRVDDVSALEIDVDRAQVTHLLMQTYSESSVHAKRGTARGEWERKGKPKIDLRGDQAVEIQPHVVPVNVPELDVHESVELDRYESRGGGGGRLSLKAQETTGTAHGLRVRRDEEGKAGANR